MALSPEELAFVRQAVSEPTDDNGWTEERFNAVAVGAVLPGGAYDLRLLSALVWEAKAAALVDMVDVSESGSSRDQSQAFDHAIEMAKRFGANPTTPTSAAARTRSMRMVRPRIGE